MARPYRYSEAEIIDALHACFSREGATTVALYRAFGRGPSVSAVVGRFGTWRAALAAAGLPCAPAPAVACGGAEHGQWRGDAARSETKRRRAQRAFPLDGVICEREGCNRAATDRHHKDGDTGHNDRSNLEFLCRRHHMEADGRLRDIAAYRQPVQPPKPCSNCGKLRKPLRHGRCGACAEYLRRTGEERPVDPETGEPLVRRFGA